MKDPKSRSNVLIVGSTGALALIITAASWAFAVTQATGAGGRGTAICVDSDIPGAAAQVVATIQRLQPQIRTAHQQVAASFASAGDEPWPAYAPVTVAARCPNGAPKLTVPSDGRLLRDTSVRGAVHAPSEYELKVFVLSSQGAESLLGGQPYLRMKYEQVCDENGGSCATSSVALFIAEEDTSNDALLFDVIADGLGFRQQLKYPTGHPASDDRQTK